MKHKQGKKTTSKDKYLYVLEVFVIGGPVTQRFAQQNPVISRTIEIRGGQTLEDLHRAIFDALDREDEHMYEFQFGNGPHDPQAERYVLPMALESPVGDSQPAGDTTHTTIGSLNLKVDQAFGYWFDFGDDWWHQINVIAISETAPQGVYPKVTERTGASPPQYVDWEEEDDY